MGQGAEDRSGTSAAGSDAELRRRLKVAKAKARDLGQGSPALERSWHFYLLYNEKHGVFGDRPGNPFALTRRQWLERMVKIEDKAFNVIPFIYNQSQRNLEAIIVRAERNRRPSRVVILKVRQNGISTWELAFNLWFALCRVNRKVRIITDREDLCSILRARLEIMLRNLAHGAHELPAAHELDTRWNLVPLHSNRDLIEFDEPFHSSIHFVSSNTPSPGFGETMSAVIMEETTKWIDIEDKVKGVLNTLPDLEGTYAIDVSQAKGNVGYFPDKFRNAWARQHGLAQPGTDENSVLSKFQQGWQAMFIPWFLHQEYRWTNLGGNPKTLPPEVATAVMNSLNQEERVLLKQRYFLRGAGWKTVDLDQLAWRRFYISEKCNGSLAAFHEQYPAFPEEAFLATGKSAFNVEHAQRAMATVQREPMGVFDLVGSDA